MRLKLKIKFSQEHLEKPVPLQVQEEWRQGILLLQAQRDVVGPLV